MAKYEWWIAMVQRSVLTRKISGKHENEKKDQSASVCALQSKFFTEAKIKRNEMKTLHAAIFCLFGECNFSCIKTIN